MTALNATTELETITRDTSGSNVIDYDQNGRAIVRDVALFAEDANHPDLGEADRDMLDRIVSRTNELASQGRHTQGVIRHEKKGEAADQQSYGTVRDLRVGESGGRLFIFGDMHMRRWDVGVIERYPRRSAEIFMQDGKADGRLWMGNIALLGREIPRADIPDLTVSLNDGADTRVAEIETELPPVTFGSQEPQMDSKSVKKFLDDMDEKDRKDFLKKYSDEDADDNKAEDKKSDNSAGAAPVVAEQPQPVNFAETPEGIAMAAQIGALQAQNRRNDVEKNLRDLSDRGVQFDFDDECTRLTAIIDDEARTAEFSRMEKNYSRIETAASAIHASKSAAVFANAAQPATSQVLTSADCASISTKAAEFMDSSPGLSQTEATAKAVEALNLTDKVNAARG